MGRQLIRHALLATAFVVVGPATALSQDIDTRDWPGDWDTWQFPYPGPGILGYGQFFRAPSSFTYLHSFSLWFATHSFVPPAVATVGIARLSRTHR